MGVVNAPPFGRGGLLLLKGVFFDMSSTRDMALQELRKARDAYREAELREVKSKAKAAQEARAAKRPAVQKVDSKLARVDRDLLQNVRTALHMKLLHRLNGAFTEHADGNITADTWDSDFAERIGPGLRAVSETRIIHEALKLMLDHVLDAKGNTVGILWFDK